MKKVLVKLAISRTDAARGQEIEVSVGEAMRMQDHNQIEQPSAEVKAVIDAHRAEVEDADEVELDGLGSQSDLLVLSDERIAELEAELKASETAKSAALVELDQAVKKLADVEAELAEATQALEVALQDLADAAAKIEVLEVPVADLSKPDVSAAQKSEEKTKAGKSSGAGA